MSRRVTPLDLCCDWFEATVLPPHFLQSLSAHHRLRDDEGLHPPDLGEDRVLRSPRTPRFLSALVYAQWRARGSRRPACTDCVGQPVQTPPLPKSSKTPTRPCFESVQILRKDRNGHRPPPSSGFFGSFRKRNPLAAFKEEPHKWQQRHEF
jgi:hypothetical protein